MSQFISNNSSNLDQRYSRQSYTIGQDAQTKLSVASVLIIGYNSLSQEIIRNLCLIGVSLIDIYYENILQNYQKAGLYYPINKNIDKPIPLEEFRLLNPTIKINSVNILDEDKQLDRSILKKYNIIIVPGGIIEDSLDINKLTHKLNIPFIMCGSYGLMGYVFNDFGDKFTIMDLDGEISEPLLLESIDGKLLKFKDQHKLSDGDIINIQWSDLTESEYKVHRKKSPLIVELTELANPNKESYLKIIRKKIQQEFNFEPLKRNLEDINYVISDWSVSPDRIKLLHKLHLAYDKYLSDYGDDPRAWSLTDYDIFEKYLSDLEPNEKIIAKKFSYTLRGDLLPFISIIGGIVSHEVLKALTHKYIPISQWYYMDYFDLISDEEILKHNDYTSSNFKTKSKYEGIVNIFGKKFLEEFQNTVPFVIGSGAIGCELIKNLGMMGVKQIYLTDPDHIEKSNLSRQFLFNDSDLRESKAETAAKKIKLMNPDTNVIVLKEKVCSQTENIFNSEFHSKIDIYLNALDNVDARIYMDTMALKYTKPLIDSGTMGSKGNVQVVIPHLTESYGSTKDPEEKNSIPICTIKSFPYNSAHTIQWAREIFETEFNQIPNLLNKFKNYEELEKINDSDSKIFLKQLFKYKDFELNAESYFKILQSIFRENHIDNIKEIIDKFSKIENKEELADKKLPIYLGSEPDDWNCDIVIRYTNYLIDGLNILNQIFKTDIDFESGDEFNTSFAKRLFTDNDYKLDQNYNLDELKSEQIIKILKDIINPIPYANPIDFEKDDDELGHVGWINLSSNMRNLQYGIPLSELDETRRIAGNIIPAMITTTALISGFQIMEYIRICKLYKKNKYLDKKYSKEIELYKNRFVNLNTNYLDGINPSQMQTFEITDEKILSIWSNFIIKNSNTVDLIKEIESQYEKKIEFITMGNTTVYDGEQINIGKLDNSENILILLEDIPIGIPIIIKT